MKVTVHTHDPILTLIYPPEKTIDYFGEDFLEEYGIEIPDDFLARYNMAWEEFWKCQEELIKLMKEQESKNVNAK